MPAAYWAESEVNETSKEDCAWVPCCLPVSTLASVVAATPEPTVNSPKPKFALMIFTLPPDIGFSYLNNIDSYFSRLSLFAEVK